MPPHFRPRRSLRRSPRTTTTTTLNIRPAHVLLLCLVALPLVSGGPLIEDGYHTHDPRCSYGNVTHPDLDKDGNPCMFDLKYGLTYLFGIPNTDINETDVEAFERSNAAHAFHQHVPGTGMRRGDSYLNPDAIQPLSGPTPTRQDIEDHGYLTGAVSGYLGPGHNRMSWESSFPASIKKRYWDTALIYLSQFLGEGDVCVGFAIAAFGHPADLRGIGLDVAVQDPDTPGHFKSLMNLWTITTPFPDAEYRLVTVRVPLEELGAYQVFRLRWWSHIKDAWMDIDLDHVGRVTCPGSSASPTPTPTPSASPTLTPSPSVTASQTPSVSTTPSGSPSPSAAPSTTASASRSASPSPSPSPSVSVSVTASMTSTPTPVPSTVLRGASVISVSASATASATASVTASPTASATSSALVPEESLPDPDVDVGDPSGTSLTTPQIIFIVCGSTISLFLICVILYCVFKDRRDLCCSS